MTRSEQMKGKDIMYTVIRDIEVNGCYGSVILRALDSFTWQEMLDMGIDESDIIYLIELGRIRNIGARPKAYGDNAWINSYKNYLCNQTTEVDGFGGKRTIFEGDTYTESNLYALGLDSFVVERLINSGRISLVGEYPRDEYDFTREAQSKGYRVILQSRETRRRQINLLCD